MSSNYRTVFQRCRWLLIPAAVLALPVAMLWGLLQGVRWWLIEMREFPLAWRELKSSTPQESK